MTERFVITKVTEGWDWKSREVVCVVDDYYLASNIVAWLYVNDGTSKDEDGSEIEVVYLINREKHFTTMDEFVKNWEGE